MLSTHHPTPPNSRVIHGGRLLCALSNLLLQFFRLFRLRRVWKMRYAWRVCLRPRVVLMASMQVQTFEGCEASSLSLSLSLLLAHCLSHCCWQFPFKWKLMANKQEEATQTKRKSVCRLCGYLFVCVHPRSIWIDTRWPGTDPCTGPSLGPGPGAGLAPSSRGPSLARPGRWLILTTHATTTQRQQRHCRRPRMYLYVQP